MNNFQIKTCPGLNDGSLSDHETILRKNLAQTWYPLIIFAFPLAPRALRKDNAWNTGWKSTRRQPTRTIRTKQFFLLSLFDLISQAPSPVSHLVYLGHAYPNTCLWRLEGGRRERGEARMREKEGEGRRDKGSRGKKEGEGIVSNTNTYRRKAGRVNEGGASGTWSVGTGLLLKEGRGLRGSYDGCEPDLEIQFNGIQW